MANAVVWLRSDLRTHDQPALAAALKSGGGVTALYVLDDAAAGRWAPGGASRWWLHHSLEALDRDLAELGVPLVLRRGATVEHLMDVATATGAGLVHCSRGFEPWAAALEKQAHDKLEASGIVLKRYAGSLLHDPDVLRTQTGGPFKVYTPFWRRLEAGDIRTPQRQPDAVAVQAPAVASEALADWGLRPTRPDWAGGLRDAWQPGEDAARAALATFLSTAAEAYPDARDQPAVPGTSRLSPHLHFGEISPATCWQATMAAVEAGRLSRSSAEKFLKEIAWREFSYHLLNHAPELPEKPFRPEFARFPWVDDATQLRAWQRGQTGYPIVDAGMRELWQTGWMHNRVRMIVASFLTKHLRIPWQAGEAWFWDCLVDADLASNAASWQWVAGCGADAAPYFRIFNPIIQGEKFDPDGAYVRRFVPELAKLPAKVIHKPWTAAASVLAHAGVRLGETYPHPIVDHKTAREAALDAYGAVKAKAG